MSTETPSVPPPERSEPRESLNPFVGNTLVGVPPPPTKPLTARSIAVGSVYAGDFRILRSLAKGGMGAVYEADQISTGRRRALKVMRVRGALDAGVRDRFLREARASAMVDSPHAVEVIVAGADEATNSLWIAMEYLVGETLADRLARLEAGAVLPQHETWLVLSQLLKGLARAHTRGVIHRDLKPTNVFLARGEGDAVTVKLLDFGIACFHDAQDDKLTDPIGTPLWMAPEQARPARITPSVDVWAVGLIAFRLLFGRSYWLAARDASPNVRAVLAELLYEPLEGASERADALGCKRRLPMGFDAWFARCVNRDPSARFADANEAGAALARIAPPQGVLEPHASRRARPALHPAARPELSPGKPPLGAPPRKALLGPVSKTDRVSRARIETLHPRLDDAMPEPPTVRRDTPARDSSTEKLTAPRASAEIIPAPPPRSLAEEFPIAATTPVRPARSSMRFRVALLAAAMIGGVVAILQTPGVLRPRRERPAGAALSRLGDGTIGTWNAGESRVWRGEATGNESRYEFTAVLRHQPGGRVSGYISWSVVRSGSVPAGEQVRENVDGNFDPTLGALDLHGTLSTNALAYPVNAYRLRMRADGALEGATLDAALMLRGAPARP